MLLGEPPRTHYDLFFSVFGIPIRVHPLFWLVTLMLGSQSRDVASVLTWVAAVFLSILVHELGHAAAMRAYGFRPWIILYGLGGLTSYDQAYGFRSKGSGAVGQILINAAGPFAGFLLTAILLTGLLLAGSGEQVFFASPWGLRPVVLLANQRLANLLNDIFFISVFWGLINLLPVYPLDGGQIAREILLKFNPHDGIRQSLWLSVLAAVGMAVFGFVQWQDWLIALFFGYLAYASYAALTAYNGHRPW